MRLNGVEKKELLDAGLSIVEERGLDKLSIRSASTRVRVSTQPFYSYFVSIDAFRAGVLEYIAELYLEEADKVLSKEAPAVSYALFINDYMQKHAYLFDAIVRDGFFRKEAYHTWIQKIVEDQVMASDAQGKPVSQEKVRNFLVWAHGRTLMEEPLEAAEMIQEIREMEKEGIPAVPAHFRFRGIEI